MSISIVYLNILLRPNLHQIRFILVVQQFYQSEVNNEYVIRGNSAVLKCSIPSFVADFVSVESWLDNQGNTYLISEKENGNFSIINT